ncbi:beta-1,4-galactosyltransferase galt-1-like [Myzus persicae]|uniref:beta-1,4-galactosyltransferase galt-1-like n=1 Tax=Myzus persicae TaxID=13164 RepID=UPI000B932408|nr:beta-1,4-galactosyltransferase galt-1-like [Myzus persicae]XP_022170604.1 beta-1,4-galactosyltransferase galt-1-like [Myzus persicae]XP_022170605.1 beta-1,4-galactosyltransferase galt-1-like [Myzus persicae]
MMKTRVRLLLLLFTAALTLFVVFFVFDEKPNSVDVKDHKYYSQKHKSPTHYKPAKQQYIIHPPHVERTLPTRSGIVPRDAVWQKVQSTKYKFFIYSAYLDTRIKSVGPLIRIIGATKTRKPDPVWCRLWYANSSKTVSASVKAIRENWNLKYSAVFVLCKLPSDGNHPLSVSIVSHVKDPITNEILIQMPKPTSQLKTDIEICVKPFHYYYDRAIQLMEFVELNYLLGIGHFTFYKNTIGPNVECVLDHYTKDNLVSVLPWQLDIVSKSEIRTEGMFAALNDCLYRNMYKSKYVAFLDIDEIIVPRQNDTLIKLINWLNIYQTPAAYSFRNAFFYMQWADDDSLPLDQNPFHSNLVVLRKTRRKTKLHPHKQRSKYICDPQRIVEVGNHFIWEFLNPSDGTFYFTPERAILHHYRVCEYGGDDCVTADSTVDRTVYRYRKKLVDRITNTLSNLDTNCLIEAQANTNETMYFSN